MMPSALSDSEKHYKEALRSAEWDVGDGRAPRFQYVILSLPRSGSEFLCASLRRRGMGVPLEYFTASAMAERLGCGDGAGNIHLATYLPQLHAKRTTPNGIFGVKLHPLHLKSVAGEDSGNAALFLGLFDRTVVLRRRDKVLQAISLARAHFTGQFHIVPGDAVRPLTETDDTLFVRITECLARILEDERYVASVMAHVDPRKVATLWYEDLSESTIDGLAADFAARSGNSSPTSTPYAGHAVPQRGDAEEALSVKRRFLARITGEEWNGHAPARLSPP